LWDRRSNKVLTVSAEALLTTNYKLKTFPEANNNQGGFAPAKHFDINL
jgi:hypothetical protein